MVDVACSVVIVASCSRYFTDTQTTRRRAAQRHAML